MQADIFNTRVVKLENEQGPAMGAAMLAAFGSGWFDSLEECAEQFIHEAAAFYPKEQNVQKYKTLFELYKNIYAHKRSQYSFKELSTNLIFRRSVEGYQSNGSANVTSNVLAIEGN